MVLAGVETGAWVIRPTRSRERKCTVGPMRTWPLASHHLAMTTAHDPQATRIHARKGRRRLVAPLVAATLALGAAGAVLGVSSSPGRTHSRTASNEVAIPGVRGTGGGGGSRLYGVSTSRGNVELAVRKAGGPDPIFI